MEPRGSIPDFLIQRIEWNTTIEAFVRCRREFEWGKIDEAIMVETNKALEFYKLIFFNIVCLGLVLELDTAFQR